MSFSAKGPRVAGMRRTCVCLHVVSHYLQAHDSASKQEEVSVWEEERAESKYARGLVQLPAERTIPSDPAAWACEDSGAKENLWLNLSTGFIGSGRPVSCSQHVSARRIASGQ
jgi:uncharacterized UBP type Zn finger protein